MAEFPEMKESEYAVLFVEKATGIVVDQDGKRHNQKPHQIMFTIFDSYEEAEHWAKLRLSQQTFLESSIYNSKHEIIASF